MPWNTQQTQPVNLNTCEPDNWDEGDYPIESNNAHVEKVSVLFRDLEDILIGKIKAADAVLGAVAWLTSNEILDALACVDNVSIIVQKEDFLRPDINANNSNWRKYLRDKYNQLSCKLDRYVFPDILGRLSYCGDPSIGAVRCVGNYNRDKSPAFPRMHNKFLVFANIEDGPEWSYTIEPYAVWTGSFNFTKNATYSLENALHITIPEIVEAYFKEYQQIAALSEPLDWETDWIEPEWRIGS